MGLSFWKCNGLVPTQGVVPHAHTKPKTCSSQDYHLGVERTVALYHPCCGKQKSTWLQGRAAEVLKANNQSELRQKLTLNEELGEGRGQKVKTHFSHHRFLPQCLCSAGRSRYTQHAQCSQDRLQNQCNSDQDKVVTGNEGILLVTIIFFAHSFSSL